MLDLQPWPILVLVVLALALLALAVLVKPRKSLRPRRRWDLVFGKEGAPSEPDDGTWEDCPDCEGKGKVTCSRCLGNRTIKDEDGKTVTCPKCKGSGKIECSRCGGSGQIKVH